MEHQEVNKEDIEKPEYLPFITGKNIDLCPRSSKLVKHYIRWKNNPQVRKYARTVVPRTLETEKEKFERKFERWPDNISLDIWYKEDKKPIGYLGLGHLDWINRDANIYLFIGEPEYWNKNIATEATELLINYAFNELNLHKLHGGAAVENIGSWTVAKKIGFKVEGIEKDHMYVDGKYLDLKVHCFLKEDWVKKR